MGETKASRPFFAAQGWLRANSFALSSASLALTSLPPLYIFRAEFSH